MQLQKTFLENNGWKCVKCGCSGTKGWDCMNNDFKGYIITLRANNIGKIINKGHVVASVPLFLLNKKMQELELIKTVPT